LDATLMLLQSGAAHVCVESKTVGSKCTQVEKWFGTHHSFSKVPAELTALWMAADAACKTAGLFLRPLNKFVAVNLALKLHPASGVVANVGTAPVGNKVEESVVLHDPALPFVGYQCGRVPPTLHKLPHGELWHLMETSFHVPKVYYFFMLEVPAMATVHGMVALMTLFASLLTYTAVDLIYPAGVAGINCEVSARSSLLILFCVCVLCLCVFVFVFCVFVCLFCCCCGGVRIMFEPPGWQCVASTTGGAP
jgi:secreted Zn-dependent insulinase-like peptidase